MRACGRERPRVLSYDHDAADNEESERVPRRRSNATRDHPCHCGLGWQKTPMETPDGIDLSAVESRMPHRRAASNRAGIKKLHVKKRGLCAGRGAIHAPAQRGENRTGSAARLLREHAVASQSASKYASPSPTPTGPYQRLLFYREVSELGLSSG